MKVRSRGLPGLAEKSLYATGAQAIGLIAAVVTGALTARLLGVYGKGIFALAGACASTAVIVGSLGVSSALAYQTGWGVLSEEDFLGVAGVWAVLCGLFVGGGIWLLRGVLLGTVLRGMTEFQLAAVVLGLPAHFFIEMAASVLVGAGRMRLLALLRVVSASLILVSLTVALLFVGRDATTGITAWMLSIIVSSVVYMVVSKGRLRGSLRNFRATADSSIRYGLRSYLGGVTHLFSLRADYFFLNLLAGPAALGQYGVAVSLAEKAWLVPNALSQAAYSSMTQCEKREAARVAARAGRIAGMLAGIAGALLGVVGFVGIPLVFGAAFSPAYPLLLLLIPGVIAMAVTNVYSAFYVGHMGRPGLNSAVSVFVGLSSALMYVLWIPRFGAAGAAAASSLAYVSSTVVWAWRFPRDTGIDAREMFIPLRGDFFIVWTRLREAAGGVFLQ